MSESARFVGPVDRLIFLRSLAGLGALDASEIVAIAERAEERFYRRGSLLLREGEPVEICHFLVEGQVSTGRGGRVQRYLDAPYTVGFMAGLSRDPAGLEVRAETDVVTLALGIEDLTDTMEDNTRLTEAAIRQIARQIAEAQRLLESRGQLQREVPVDVPRPERPLDFVQRLSLLRKAGPYKDASLDALATIARHFEELRPEPGDVLFREGEPATHGLLIVQGIVRCASSDRVFRMGSGSVVGYLETMARLPRTYTATAETPMVVLRNEAEIFFDVAEDNPELGITFARFLSGVLGKLYDRLAEVSGPVREGGAG